MKKRLLAWLHRPTPPRRSVGWLLAVLALHLLGLTVLSRAPWLTGLFTTEAVNFSTLLIGGLFYALRFFVYLLSPAWVVARLWLWVSHPDTPRRTHRHHAARPPR